MRRVLLLALLLLPFGAEARRLPASGGQVRLSLPAELAEATRAAHLQRPMLEAASPGESAAERITRPPVPGTAHRSVLIRRIESDSEGQRWSVSPPSAAASIEPCLTGDASWPGRVLKQAGVTARVSQNASEATVSFSRPLGVLPELLRGCTLRDSDVASFEPAGDDSLRSRAGRAFLAEVVFVDDSGPADVAASVSPGEGALLVAPVDDVVLLIQSAEARAVDPLGLQDGLERFMGRLDPALVLAVASESRGAPAAGLLPPALAPRPPRSRSVAPADPIRLRPLPADAPTVALRSARGPLLGAARQRLALLLQDRGQAVAPSGDSTVQLIRWIPAAEDPALALLELASSHPELQTPGTADPRLLDDDRAVRLEAALDLERGWVDDGRAVPLLTAARWLVVHPDLRSVRLRWDGVPLLDRAFWVQP